MSGLHSLTKAELVARLEQATLENELFRTILDSISEGVQVSTADETMIYYNKACEKIEKVNREDCLGRKIKSIYSQTSLTNQSTLHRVVSSTTAPALNVYNQYLTNGNVTDVISSSYAYQLADASTGVYSIIRNTGLVQRYLAEIMQLERHMASDGQSRDGEAYYSFDKILHISEAMRDCIASAKRLAAMSANIMLYGETGTGKELFAQSIHNASLFSRGPFVAINCAAIPDTLLESLIFGTEKGAFTGALEQSGLLEQAANGTVFFDEMNSMHTALQAKLLRVIETRSYRRVGGKVERKINCRFISATNKDPLREIETGNLRQDVFYRLCEVMLRIPPLRERVADIAYLSQQFMEETVRKVGFSQIAAIHKDVLALFAGYGWPGNVRELKHDVEYCVCMAEEDRTIITKDVLHPDIVRKYLGKTSRKATGTSGTERGTKEPQTLKNLLEAAEDEAVRQALERHKGNITRAASELGLHRQALQYRMKKRFTP